MRKVFLPLILFVSFFSFFPKGFSESVSVTGKIEEISMLEDGRFQLTINTPEGTSTFFLDKMSLIKASLPAHKVKKGQTIFLGKKISGAKEIKGIAGIRGINTFSGNLAPSSAKALGLPNIPSIPNIPNVPGTPQIPKIPEIPKVPGGIGGLAAPSVQKEKASEKSEEQVSELPQDQTFKELNPKPVSAPLIDDVESPKHVVSLKETKEGIQVKLEGSNGQEEVLLKREEKVFQLLTVQDLKQNMNVDIQANGNSIREITIV